MKRTPVPRLKRIIGIAGGIAVLLSFLTEKIEGAIETLKVPGPYPYEETVRIPVPPPSETSPLPSPEPSFYSESSSSSAPVRDSRRTNARRALTAKTVREAAFKYNGVAKFCGFLAALPADVGVFDPKLGRTRALVKGGRVRLQNVAWLRKRRQARAHAQSRT